MSAFPLEESRPLVAAFMTPRPVIYWVDFCLSTSVGWGAFAGALQLTFLSPWQLLLYVVSSLGLYRSVIFIHELAHRKAGSFQAFEVAWNLTCGFPLMVPSYLYTRVHGDHHEPSIYGTREDGEYLPFGAERPWHMLLYVLEIFVLPLLLLVRAVVIVPLSYLHPGLRRLVWERVSSLVIDFRYRRPAPSPREGTGRGGAHGPQLQDLGAFVSGAATTTLIVTGVWPVAVAVLWYLVSVLVFLLNSLRTLAAHAYRNPGDRVMSFAEQFLDSVDVPGNRLTTPLWAPVGLRYHATHHLFPGLPYHSLGQAYRHLVRQLPDPSSYRRSSRASLWGAISRLWRDASAASRRRPAQITSGNVDAHTRS